MIDAATLELLRPVTDDFVKREVRADVEHEKTVQLAKSRRNNLYYSGKQYIHPVLREGSVVDYTTVSGTAIANEPAGRRSYQPIINELRGLVDKAVAILAQKPPNVKAQADRKDDEQCCRLARKADNIANAIRANWTMEVAIQDIAYALSLDGTTFLYTPYVTSEEKYGTTEEPIIELAEAPVEGPHYECVNCGGRTPADEGQATGACAECGAPLAPEDLREPEMAVAPQIKGAVKYANGSVELHVCDISTVTTPFWIKGLENAHWLRYEYEEYKGRLLATYSGNEAASKALQEMLDGETDGGQESATDTGRMTRDLHASPSGTPHAGTRNRWTYTQYWITPDVYHAIAKGNDEKGQIRQWFASQCPEGAKLVYVNGKLIDVQPEKLTEVWVAVKPRPSKYLYADALFDDFIPIQDEINDLHATMKEMADRNIPVTLYNPLAFDQAVLNQHRATPMEFLPVLPAVGTQLKELMWNTPTTTLEPQVMNWGSAIRGSGQDIVGVTPAAWGGATGVEKTAKQAEMDRNQALLQLGLAWNRIRLGVAQANENAVIQQSKWGNGKIIQRRRSSIGPTVIEMPDMQDVMKGGWHFKAEEAMPMTWGQRRDNWREMMTEAGTNPLVAQMIGADDPENAEIAQEALGMADWNVPQLNALYKVRDTIRALSQQAPIEQRDPMTGMVAELQPSIPPDEFEDDHVFVVRVVKGWSQTENARELRETNPDGYANVIAWGRAHEQFTLPPPMPAPGPDGPQGPPSGGKEPGPPDTAPENGPGAAPPPEESAQQSAIPPAQPALPQAA